MGIICMNWNIRWEQNVSAHIDELISIVQRDSLIELLNHHHSVLNIENATQRTCIDDDRILPDHS